MFDIGFWELVLVGIVSLLVFGPERLPRVARETALWVRKARAMVASVKAEIDHELQLQELRESLAKEKKRLERMPPLREIGASTEPIDSDKAVSQKASEPVATDGSGERSHERA
ncbi:Sec-independent protein translocase protein TatB [Candidatus Methylocalor cossyra]|uniref:Sec-independent protein translocase protein TatB n=1 Tax=Candidatus Methylocalor cossyra TaxID=3108543 RepID=A0ABM9NKR0_9GAMM